MIDEEEADKLAIKKATAENLTEAYAILLASLQGTQLSNISVNRMLQITLHPNFDADVTPGVFHNFRGARAWLKAREQAGYERDGFKKVRVVINDGEGECDIWVRNAKDVLKCQIEGAGLEDIVYKYREESVQESEVCDSERIFHGTVSGNLAKDAFPAIETFIRGIGRKVSGVVWNDGTVGDEISWVGGLQTFSDKTATSLKTGAKAFYPFNLTLINFSHGYTHSMSVGSKATTHFPFTAIASRYIASGISGNREKMMELLHKAIKVALPPVQDVQLSGIATKCSDGVSRVMHSAVASIVTDTPEGKDLASVSGSYTVCTGCETEGDKFYVCQLEGHDFRNGDLKSRNFKEDNELRKKLKIAMRRGNLAIFKETKKELSSRSLSAVLPFCSEWYFIDDEIHPLLSFYECIGFERMHNIHLGVAKTVFEAIWSRLGDPDFVSASFLTKAGNARSFNNIKSKILKCVNEMLIWIDANSPMKKFRCDFSSAKSTEALHGFFTK